MISTITAALLQRPRIPRYGGRCQRMVRPRRVGIGLFREDLLRSGCPASVVGDSVPPRCTTPSLNESSISSCISDVIGEVLANRLDSRIQVIRFNLGHRAADIFGDRFRIGRDLIQMIDQEICRFRGIHAGCDVHDRADIIVERSLFANCGSMPGTLQ